MGSLFWLIDDQMARLRPYFPKSHGKPRADDRDMGVLAWMMQGLASESGAQTTIMMDGEAGGATGPSLRPNELKAHRTASSLRVKKGARSADRAHQGRDEHQAPRRHGRSGPTIRFFMSAGQVSDYTGACAMMGSLPTAEWLIADRG